MFANKESISHGILIEAYKLWGNADEKGKPFVSMTLELEGEL